MQHWRDESCRLMSIRAERGRWIIESESHFSSVRDIDVLLSPQQWPRVGLYRPQCYANHRLNPGRPNTNQLFVYQARFHITFFKGTGELQRSQLELTLITFIIIFTLKTDCFSCHERYCTTSWQMGSETIQSETEVLDPAQIKH